jgi:hypothetical protein
MGPKNKKVVVWGVGVQMLVVRVPSEKSVVVWGLIYIFSIIKTFTLSLLKQHFSQILTSALKIHPH